MTPDQLHQVTLADPEASEDCLFLNVVVPKAVIDSVSSSSSGNDDHASASGDLAPVLVWLHGGGYVFGHKDDALYDPSGLISRSKTEGSKGVIYVAVNYRLGLFGWLNGVGDDAPSIQLVSPPPFFLSHSFSGTRCIRVSLSHYTFLYSVCFC